LYRRPSGSQDAGEFRRVLARDLDRRRGTKAGAFRSIGATNGSASEENAKAPYPQKQTQCSDQNRTHSDSNRVPNEYSLHRSSSIGANRRTATERYSVYHLRG